MPVSHKHDRFEFECVESKLLTLETTVVPLFLLLPKAAGRDVTTTASAEPRQWAMGSWDFSWFAAWCFQSKKIRRVVIVLGESMRSRPAVSLPLKNGVVFCSRG